MSEKLETSEKSETNDTRMVHVYSVNNGMNTNYSGKNKWGAGMREHYKDKLKAERILQEEMGGADVLRQARLNYAKAEAEIKLEIYKIDKRLKRDIFILESVRFALIVASIIFLTYYVGGY